MGQLKNNYEPWRKYEESRLWVKKFTANGVMHGMQTDIPSVTAVPLLHCIINGRGMSDFSGVTSQAAVQITAECENLPQADLY